MGSTNTLVSHSHLNKCCFSRINSSSKSQTSLQFNRNIATSRFPDQLKRCSSSSKRFGRIVCSAVEDVNGQQQKKLQELGGSGGVGSALEENPAGVVMGQRMLERFGDNQPFGCLDLGNGITHTFRVRRRTVAGNRFVYDLLNSWPYIRGKVVVEGDLFHIQEV